MKRLMVLVIAISMVCTGVALGEVSPVGMYHDMNFTFGRFQSYIMNADGEWSAHDLQAAQLLRTVVSGAARNYMSAGACILYPSVRGNAELGFAEVLLNVCLVRSSPLGGESISIVTDGIRYDFVTTPTKEMIGKYSCERFILPLDALGMIMLRSIAQGGCDLSLYGGAKLYCTKIVEAESATSKQKFEATSLIAIRSLLAELDGAGMENYALWDLNEGHWSSNRPQMEMVVLGEITVQDDWPELNTIFESVTPVERKQVAKLQLMLMDAAFYSGKMDGQYGSDTRAAIREAQQYYGLGPTGYADSRLLILLAGGTLSVDQEPGEDALLVDPNKQTEAVWREFVECKGVAKVRLDRAWIARMLRPSHAKSQSAALPFAIAPSKPSTTPVPTPNPSLAPSADIKVKNASNVFLAVDGEITNLSSNPLFLPLSAEAVLTVDGNYTYPCTVRCEQAGGQVFGTELLPLETSRLLIYAEIPGAAAVLSSELKLKVVTVSGELSLTLLSAASDEDR